MLILKSVKIDLQIFLFAKLKFSIATSEKLSRMIHDIIIKCAGNETENALQILTGKSNR